MKHLIAFTICLVLAHSVSSQVLFTAKANRYKVAVGETFQVTFAINTNADGFSYPAFTNFKVISGPNIGSSTTIFNGRMQQEKSANFTLLPLSTGTFTIGAASVKVDGKTYTTKPLSITVVAEKTVAPNSPEAKAAALAKAKVLTNKNTVYVGEPFVARYAILLKTSISGYDMLNEPDLSGFVKNEIEIKGSPNREEVIDGERITAVDIKRLVLIPQQSGTFKPGNLSLRLPTPVPTGRRTFFGPEQVTVNQISNSPFPTLTVKPLPASGKPTDFSGAVGDYKLYVSLSRNEVNADESITLTIEVSGKGNIQLLSLPEPILPADIEAFEPKYKEQISAKLSGVSGYKRNEYLLIPRYKGQYKIPALKFSFFNPKTEKYETLTSEALEINVVNGPKSAGNIGGNTNAQADKASVNAINQDILFIHTQPSPFAPHGNDILSAIWFRALWILLFAAIIGMFVFNRVRATYQPDREKALRKKAGSIAEKVLKNAKTHAENGDVKSFYSALSEALQLYFSNKFGLQPAAFSTENTTTMLKEKGAGGAVIDAVAHLIKQADMARFAPLNQGNMLTDYEKARQTISELEKI